MREFVSRLRQENPVPGFLLFCLLGVFLVVLANLDLLPEELLIIYGGVGFLLAGVFVPDGFHSTWNGLYFLLAAVISYLPWWALWLGVRGRWRK